MHISKRVVIVQLFCHVRLCVTPWTAAHQAPLSFTISRSLLKLMSIEFVMPSNHLILCHPLKGCCVSVTHSSHVRLFGTPWTVTHQIPLSLEFSRQENCSGLSLLSPEGWKHIVKYDNLSQVSI